MMSLMGSGKSNPFGLVILEKLIPRIVKKFTIFRSFFGLFSSN